VRGCLSTCGEESNPKDGAARKSEVRPSETAGRVKCRSPLTAGRRWVLLDSVMILSSVAKEKGKSGRRRGTIGEAARERLIVFTRYPRPGTTKTRLIPLLGEIGAARLQRRMTELLVQRARDLRHERRITIEVSFHGGPEEAVRAWLGNDLSYRRQRGRDLGERLCRAFQSAFREGARRVIAIGSDCPEITVETLNRAFDSLREAELVLGPARDGGYYLVGSCRLFPELFRNMAWGTETVFEETIKRARALGIATALLEPLSDVDRPEDLSVWERQGGAFSFTAEEPLISVIIPALNESESLPAALESALCGRNVEVTVVDGGSADETVSQARRKHVRVLAARRGRASQQNAGARAARGDIFLFLHADTVLPPGYDREVRRILSVPRTVLGAFRLAIAAGGSGLRIIERLADFRSRVLRMPYGDQALFMTRKTFEGSGGFPHLSFMEDFEFVRRLRRSGAVRISPLHVTTSARRWLSLGIFSTTLINQAVILGYLAGVSPSTLKRWYENPPRRVRRRPLSPFPSR